MIDVLASIARSSLYVAAFIGAVGFVVSVVLSWTIGADDD